jgi:F-type H+-transporting ATPase subunit epsilon
MKSFELQLLSNHGTQRFATVTRFIGADENGSFGILAGHGPIVVLLRYGLARFALTDSNDWQFLAIPGGVLQFSDGQLTITALRYFVGMQREEIYACLEAEINRDNSELRAAHTTLTEIERSLLHKLAELGANPLQ